MLQSVREFIEAPAGQQIISIMLILLGTGVMDSTHRQDVAKDIVVFSLGVMSRSMQTKHQEQPKI